MVLSSRILALSYHPASPQLSIYNNNINFALLTFRPNLKTNLKCRSMPSDYDSSSSSPLDSDSLETNVSGFCIIEGPETVQDFAKMEIQEIQDNIRSRRNKIFLHMEELELKLGIGGTSYADFIQSMHLPMQLSEVDPIVASFSGGAVGVISALMVVEINNVKQQEQKRCKYCLGTGYLACARCSSSGGLVLIEPVATASAGDQPLSPPKTDRCSNCSGAGKVMCPTCLCTGMAMASEHDPRIDPFD
ncbi:hypothetical protein ACET3Z_009628 [Daucus carota]